jgi:hypothetical protein
MFDVASDDVDDVGCCANRGCIVGRWTWLVNLGHFAQHMIPTLIQQVLKAGGYGNAVYNIAPSVVALPSLTLCVPLISVLF